MGLGALEGLFDFSKSIDDWMELITQFFNILVDFFKFLGLDLFEDPTEAPAEPVE